MKKLFLIIGVVMLLGFTANAQTVEGTYANSDTEWTFTETNEAQAYTFTAVNSGKKYAVGQAFYSNSHNSFVVIFKVIGDNDNIGYAVCKLEKNVVDAKTLNPDGTKRWSGKLRKK